MDNTIIAYLAKTSIAIALFYGAYMLFMRGDTFLKLRRFYFLFAIAFSLLFPAFNIEMPAKDNAAAQIPAYWLSDIYVSQQQVQPASISIQGMMLAVLGIASAFCLAKFLVQLVSIVRLRTSSETHKVQQYRIVKMKTERLSPFSFFNWIFINTGGCDEQKLNEIIAHEQVHARQWHSVDNLLAELLCAFFWWNPFAWLMKKEIKMNLEYLADYGVLDMGYDSREYQYILLQETSKNSSIPLINNFNMSQLKRRIIMMNKEKSSILASLKYLLIIPIAAILLLGNAVQASPDLIKMTSDKLFDTPQDKVDKMPEYPGGEKAMMRYLAQNLIYPVEAQKAGVQGLVAVQFIVKKDGSIADITVLKGISPECDAEAIRVVKGMPNWTPAKLNGADVDFKYTLPVVFKLSGGSSLHFNTGDSIGDNSVVVVGYGNQKSVETQETTGDKPFEAVDQMPEYTGGVQAMYSYIGSNLKYPVKAQKAGIQGRVVVRFVVGKDGSITDVTVLQGIDPECDAEAVRVIKAMPKWIPGRENGQNVKVYFNMPIQFRLHGDKPANANK